MDAVSDDDPTLRRSDDDAIIREAKDRFKRCEEWEGEARAHWIKDLRFAEGDSRNMYQWEDTDAQARIQQSLPCLTVNKVRQHILKITNECLMDKPAVKISPTGGGATFDSAQVFAGVIRAIEYHTNAEEAWDTAFNAAVKAGCGWVRIDTAYVDEDSFDQEIRFRRVKDQLAIYLDPDITEADGSDARFGFAFEDMPRDEFERRFPGKLVASTSIDDDGGWYDDEHVRLAEYFRVTQKRDKLIAFYPPDDPDAGLPDPVTKMMAQQDGGPITIRKSVLKGAGDVLAAIMEDDRTQVRDILTPEIEWFLIGADVILERRPWPGRFIPFIRVVPEETIIDRTLDRKGHTRAMLDPQRMYNYMTSTAAQTIAMQPVSPFLAPAAAIEGFETYWSDANRTPRSILPYKHMDEQGQPIPPPVRVESPNFPGASLQALTLSGQEIMSVSGQHEAMLGEPSNERSGKAIYGRQKQGDTATYHYTNALARAVRFAGKILIDLIPKIYDTPRVIKILGEDGKEQHVKLDPEAPQAHQDAGNVDDQEIASIFNPMVGKYAVQAEVGPNYGTRRQEAFERLSEMIPQAPNLMQAAGDLMFRAANFPMSDQIAERLHRTIPKEILGEGPTPAEAQAQQQVQQMQGVLAQMANKIAELNLEADNKQKEIDIRAYEAETKRLTAATNAPPAFPAEMVTPVVMEVLRQMMGDNIQAQVQQPNVNPQTAGMPVPNAPLSQGIDHAAPNIPPMMG